MDAARKIEIMGILNGVWTLTEASTSRFCWTRREPCSPKGRISWTSAPARPGPDRSRSARRRSGGGCNRPWRPSGRLFPKPAFPSTPRGPKLSKTSTPPSVRSWSTTFPPAKTIPPCFRPSPGWGSPMSPCTSGEPPGRWVHSHFTRMLRRRSWPISTGGSTRWSPLETMSSYSNSSLTSRPPRHLSKSKTKNTISRSY